MKKDNMSLQEVFDFVVDKMRKQKRQSKDKWRSKYIHKGIIPDDSVASPIGWMINAEDGYNKDTVEKFAPAVLFGNNSPLNKSFIARHKAHEDLLIMLNNIHDMYEVERWEEGWKEVAKKHNLSYTSLSNNSLVPEEEVSFTTKSKDKFQFLSRHTELLEVKEQVLKEMILINNQALYVAEGFKHSDLTLEWIDINSITTENLTKALAKYNSIVEKYKADTKQALHDRAKSIKKIPNGSKIKIMEKGIEFFGHVVSDKSRMGNNYIVVEWDVNFLCSAIKIDEVEVVEGK